MTLPSDARSRIDVSVLSGTIRNGGDVSDSGGFANSVAEFTPQEGEAGQSRDVRVEVYIVSGDVSFSQAR